MLSAVVFITPGVLPSQLVPGRWAKIDFLGVAVLLALPIEAACAPASTTRRTWSGWAAGVARAAVRGRRAAAPVAKGVRKRRRTGIITSPHGGAGMFTRRVLFVVALAAPAGSSRADEIEVAKVPAAVRKSADAAVAGKTALKNVKWTAAERRTDEKVVRYDLEGETADGYGVFITVTAAGVVEDLSEEVDFAKLPAAVLKAVRDAVPGLNEDEAVARRCLSGKNLADVSFEVEAEDAKGRYVWLDSAPDGTIDEFYTEVTLRDLPKPVLDAVNTTFPKRRSATCYAVQVKGKLARYDVAVVRGNGAESSASFTPAGRLIKD